MASGATHAIGKVTRLYVHGDGTRIRLEVTPDLQPLNGYFKLEPSHPNYNAIYSLALSAAVNGYPLHLRTDGEITSAAEATITYAVVDW
jgi:hypothetical protein